MATLSDNFDDNSINTSIWDITAVNNSVAEQNQQIEADSTGYGQGGLVTDITYNLTAASSVQATDILKSNEYWVMICLTHVTASNPYTEADWYRFGHTGSTAYYAQKKVDGGDVTTISSGSTAGLGAFKIDLPSSGDEVRFVWEGVEKASDATYALASRDCYIYVFGLANSSGQDHDFDDFSMTYGAGGQTIILDALTGTGSAPNTSLSLGAVQLAMDVLSGVGSAPNSTLSLGAVQLAMNVLSAASSTPNATIIALIGTVTWGHDTGVIEENTRNFTGLWAGTGIVEGSDDAEIIVLDSGEYMESETWHIGAGTIRLRCNVYASGAGTPSIKYKEGDSEVNCEADDWHDYSTPFAGDGWIKVRLEN